MHYKIKDLPVETLLPAIARAEDRLARLDEIVRTSPVGEGFIARGHFHDAVASMRVTGELVDVEDLVLHDAQMDIRTPTHELTIAHAIVRMRRRLAMSAAGWGFSDAGISTLTGHEPNFEEPGLVAPEDENKPQFLGDDTDPLTIELARMDAILARSKQLIDGQGNGKRPLAANTMPLIISDPALRDRDRDEPTRLVQWKAVVESVEGLPVTLAAALIYDAWESLEPLPRQHHSGTLLACDYLRFKGKVTTHLFGFNPGLMTVQRERRRSQNRTRRLLALLEAMAVAADGGMKEMMRLTQAREQMQRRLTGRRSSSRLPVVIDLLLSRPIVSAAMIAQAAKLTPRGALNLIAELGVRELTGRGRYRAWGVI